MCWDGQFIYEVQSDNNIVTLQCFSCAIFFLELVCDETIVISNLTTTCMLYLHKYEILVSACRAGIIFCPCQANRGESEASAKGECKGQVMCEGRSAEKSHRVLSFSCFACLLLYRAGPANPPVLQAILVSAANCSCKVI